MNIRAIINEVLTSISVPDTYAKAFAEPLQGSFNVNTQFGVDMDSGSGVHLHRGHDYSLTTGTPVYAARSGEVTLTYENGYQVWPSGDDGSPGLYGNQVRISDGAGLETRYGHFEKVLVSVGEHVEAGQQIGTGGTTGRSSGPHLHYEHTWNGTPIDPEPLRSHGAPVNTEWMQIFSNLTKQLREWYDKQATSTEPGWPKPAREFTTMLVEAIDTAIVKAGQAGAPASALDFWKNLSEKLKHSGSLQETNNLLESAFDWAEENIVDPVEEAIGGWVGDITEWLAKVSGSVAIGVIGIVLIGAGVWGIVGQSKAGKTAQDVAMLAATKGGSLAKRKVKK